PRSVGGRADDRRRTGGHRRTSTRGAWRASLGAGRACRGDAHRGSRPLVQPGADPDRGGGDGACVWAAGRDRSRRASRSARSPADPWRSRSSPERRATTAHERATPSAGAQGRRRRGGIVSLRLDLRSVLGAAIGVIAGLVSVLFGHTSENAPLTVIAVLTIALVGLSLGAAASLYAYITAS